MKFKSLEEAVANRKVLVLGIGGGGDAAGAIYLYQKVRRFGGRPILGSVVWERYAIDPYPGPIPLEAMVDVDILGDSAALVSGSSYAIRFGRQVRPQIVRAAELLGEKALFVDISRGSEGVRRALEAARDQLGVELVIGVDVGGDVLALGCEENLWSPLADSVSLAGLGSAGVDSLIAVHGPGADGELSTDQVLSYIADVAAQGGLLGIYGINEEEAELLDRATKAIETEASLMPLLAFRGRRGDQRIRGGTRTVRLSPVLATTYVMDATTVYNRSPLAKAVSGTMGISQVRQVLNSMCVYTELDLEYDLFNMRGSTSPRPMSLDDIRREGIGRLVRQGCGPVKC
ncbi:DUF1152 domain-containing protein [Acidilobus sp.]|uniref:DUF1152 domain-containing protein n=1 Tax=Acidilobus sp. TaxID=1872109 RepID=UPI003D06B21A